MKNQMSRGEFIRLGGLSFADYYQPLAEEFRKKDGVINYQNHQTDVFGIKWILIHA